jgi:hypothetical protein
MLKVNYRLSVSVGVQLSDVTTFEFFETRMDWGSQIWSMKFRINVGDRRDSVAGFFLFPPNAFDPGVEYYNYMLL